MPTLRPRPTADPITHGQTLAASAPTGGSASVPGTLDWTTPSTTPSTGNAEQSVTLTPTDTTNYKPVAGPVSVTVNKANSALLLNSSANPSPTGSNVTFTATLSAVAPGSGTPTGTMTFKDNSMILGAGRLNGGSVATFTTDSLTQGSHTISAEYAGDSNFIGSGGTLSPDQVVNLVPTATSPTRTRAPGLSLKIKVSDLGTDGDADALSVTALGGASQSANISHNTTYVSTCRRAATTTTTASLTQLATGTAARPAAPSR